MLTVLGQLATNKGHVQQVDRVGDKDLFVMRADSYQRHQPLLPVVVEHDPTWVVGAVQWLERSRSDGLLAVAQVRDDWADMLSDGDWFLSGGTKCRATGVTEFGLAKLHEVSLVRHPGNVCTRPVCWSATSGQPRSMPMHWRACWDRAHEAMGTYRHRRADHLVINDLDELSLYDEVMTDPDAARARVAKAAAAATVKTRAAAPRPSRPAPRSLTRSDAARDAAELGVDGYSYVGGDGERRYVRHTGGVTDLTDA